MAMSIRRNLISLSLKHHPNPFSSSLCTTHSSSSFSSSAAAEEKRLTIADYLQQRHQFPPDSVSKLVSSGKYLRTPEKCDSVLSYFKEIGFSTTHLQQMVKRYPEIVSSNIDLTIKPKIKLFQEAGLSLTQISEVLSANPWLLSRSYNRISLAISELKRVLGPSLDLFSFLKNCNSTWFVTRSLIPNIELLLSCGISPSQMASLMNYSSDFMFQRHDYIKKCIQTVEDMGCDRTYKSFIYALRTVSSKSAENWERKLEVFRNVGFSEDDIRSAFRRFPQVFSISESNIKDSTKVFLNATNGDISVVVNRPQLLMLSVEKTVKPRLRVLEVLESKKLLAKKPNLTAVMNLSKKDFLMKYVLPYSDEVGNIFDSQEAPIEAQFLLAEKSPIGTIH